MTVGSTGLNYVFELLNSKNLEEMLVPKQPLKVVMQL